MKERRKRLPAWFGRLILVLLLVATAATAAWAQDTTGNQNIVESPQSRSYAFDIGIFVVLVGAALFAICRSSRRS